MPDEHAPTTTPTATAPQDTTQQTPQQSPTQSPTQTPQQQGYPTPPPAPKPTPDPTPTPSPADCPPPKKCPEWPPFVCPPTKLNPCDKIPDDEAEPPAPDPKAPPVKTGSCTLPPVGNDPAAQITALRAQLEAEQHQADQIERVKASIDDLTSRIGDLQKIVDGKAERAAGFREFYRATQITASEIGCSITTIRCQLEKLSAADRQCVTTAIAGVDATIKRAKDQLDGQRTRVDRAEARRTRAQWEADWAQKQLDFLDSKLKERVQKQLDDLEALRKLADPAGNLCVAEFYLREMETLLASCYGTDGTACCWVLDVTTVGSFLDCWSDWSGDGCYVRMYNRAVVENNNAAWTLKCRIALHEAAKKRLEEHQKTYDELVPKRRDLILAALKESCCKSPSP